MKTKLNLLELFAGSRSVGRVAEQLNFNVFSCDIEQFENINYSIDILNFDVSKVPFVPHVVWASPPCTYFSVASIGKHWTEDHKPKTENAKHGVKIVKKTLEIIDYFKKINPALIFFIENPRGKLRKLNFIFSIPRVTVWYCKYKDKRAKPTDIWSNNIKTLFNPNGWQPRPECFNGNKKCHHEEAPRGAKTGTQGIKGNYKRSKIPYELCKEILLSAINKLN
jgi:site-specific DNA-cytosine methylase